MDTITPAHVITFLTSRTFRPDTFLAAMADRASRNMPFTPNMLAALERCITQDAERAAERAERIANAVESGHIGEVGKRFVIQVKVTMVREIENMYGTSYLVLMITPDGDVLKTFGSGAWARSAEVSDEWQAVKATVKAHDEYQGSLQTLVTRVAAA